MVIVPSEGCIGRRCSGAVAQDLCLVFFFHKEGTTEV